MNGADRRPRAATPRFGPPTLNCPVRPDEAAAFDRLVDEGASAAIRAIDIWASMAKELVFTEPYGTVAGGMVTAATRWFDWAKGFQQIPMLGGAGQQATSSAAIVEVRGDSGGLERATRPTSGSGD